MELRLKPGMFEFGAYGYIFKCQAAQRARKLFRHGADDAHCRLVFGDEVMAYERVQAHPKLVALTAKYYGPVTVDRVLDFDGRDVSDQFLLDCCFEMELLPGPFHKIGSCIGSPNRDEVEQAFWSAGVHHTIDACVMLNDIREIIKVIDFATVYRELQHRD